MFRQTVFLLAAAFSAVLAAQTAEHPLPDADPRPVVTVGLVDTFDPAFYVQTFSETVDYLAEKLPQYRFRAVDVSWKNPEDDIARLKPDFLLVTGSYYARLSASAGAQYLVTRKAQGAPDVDHSLSSLFIVRSDSPVKTVGDLQGKAVAVTQMESFDGWLIALGELAARGFDPLTFFSAVTETGYAIPDVVTLVKSGQTQAGILSTCEYERQLALGAFAPQDLRIIGEKPTQGWCRRSTDRYPDVMTVVLPQTEPEITRAVLIALLSLPVKDHNYEWSVSDNSRGVLQLLKTLRIGPYAYLRETTLAGLYARYKTEVWLAAAFILAVLFHIIVLNGLVRSRTRALREALIERQRLYETAQKARGELEQLERITLAAQLSNLFAHEIKQPITGILYYAQALRMLIKKKGIEEPMVGHIVEKITDDATKSADIVERVRAYAKHRAVRSDCCDLKSVITEAAEPFHVQKFVTTDVPAGAFVTGDKVELVLMTANLIRNAVQAVSSVNHPFVRVTAEARGDDWTVSVTDNGPAITDAAFARLGKTVGTTKAEGLGFGLTIVAALAEKHGGVLTFERMTPKGLKACVRLKGWKTADERTKE